MQDDSCKETRKGLGSGSRALLLFGLTILAGCGAGAATEAGKLLYGGFAVHRQLLEPVKPGPSSDYLPNEILGWGAALLDYDGDGDYDVYLRRSGGSVRNVPGESGDRLFRNRWAEDGVLEFEDVSVIAGIGSYGRAFGVAVGDIDNDGDPDLFLTNLGPDVMLENREGVFVRRAGPWEDSLWSAPATFFDADRDGLLDLFVGQYVSFDPDRHRPCPGLDTRPDFCGPKTYASLPDAIFRNAGQGMFEEVVLVGSIGSRRGNALGVIAEDFDSDGLLDLFVANDAGDNHLWLNRGAFRFEDQAGFRGLAVNASGQKEAGMGVAAGDFDRDGDFDLVLTHLTGESHTLYVNRGDGFFDDRTRSSLLELPSLPHTGFGVGWLHADGDAWLDLLVVNGRISTIPEQRSRGSRWPYRETPQMMLSDAGAKFRDGSMENGSFFDRMMMGRAAAFGDLDQDGDLDLVVTDNDGSALVVGNHSRSNLQWVGIIPRSGSPPRDAVGTKIAARLDDGSVLVARSRSDGSYLSARDPRILFRLPAGSLVTSMEISWPSGCVEVVSAPEVGRYHVLHQECENDA